MSSNAFDVKKGPMKGVSGSSINGVKSGAEDIRCPACGSAHPNPVLKETYRYCMNCSSVMREAKAIDLSKIPKASGRLLCIAASYGHLDDASKAINVRELIQAKIEGHGAKDCLNIPPQTNLLQYFGLDIGESPCTLNEGRKCIRARFWVEGRRSEVIAIEGAKEFHLENLGLFFSVPKSPPTLILGECWYGHPRGLINGRGAFDVSEVLQARVEESGGTFLEINRLESLRDLFGDPCPNRRKNLVINYEIHGSSGSFVAEEVEGHLKKPIDLSYTPLIAPLIVIEKATYGMTKEGVNEKVRDIQIELYSLNAISNRKALGLPISAEDNARLTNEDGTPRVPHLTKKLAIAEELKEGYVDVTSHLQERVEESGGGRIEIGQAEDLNTLFGSNPNPGYPKQIRITFTVLGHDSERQTHSNEITYPSGFPRNYIMPRSDNQIVEAVEVRSGGNEEGGERVNSHLTEDLYVVCPKVLTTLEITQGFYGKTGNYKKIFDVTAELRQLSFLQGGNKLQISDTSRLADLFRDPARGVRKELRCSYTIRGFSGTMRIEAINSVRSEASYLRSTIHIGYLPREGTKAHNRRESRKVSMSVAVGGAMAALKFLKGTRQKVKKRKGTILVTNAEAIEEEGGGEGVERGKGVEGGKEDMDIMEEEEDKKVGN